MKFITFNGYFMAERITNVSQIFPEETPSQSFFENVKNFVAEYPIPSVIIFGLFGLFVVFGIHSRINAGVRRAMVRDAERENQIIKRRSRSH